MNNRYDHFANSGMRDIECVLNEAKGNTKRSRLGWQDMMEDQLVVDIQDIIAVLKGKQLSPLERAWRTNMALKMLIHDFASGILYAQEQLG